MLDADLGSLMWECRHLTSRQNACSHVTFGHGTPNLPIAQFCLKYPGVMQGRNGLVYFLQEAPDGFQGTAPLPS